jgi:glutamate/tyrosine decarboxylase-like PLP-dependent enzyme
MSAVSAADAAYDAAEAATNVKTIRKRKALHAYLSDQAHESWHQFASTHGISVSATLESPAVELDDEHPASGKIDFAPIVKRARTTDAARRRRRR